MELNTKYGKIKIYAKTLEDEALAQIIKMANSPLGEGAHIRIMPDAHAGKGCTVGTTMRITDKVCPNIVGVDIGCGMNLVYTNIDFKDRLNELDRTIRKYVPCGQRVHDSFQVEESYFKGLRCWNELSDAARKNALSALGSLGGGNHYIEAYENGALCVHSGSRNLGLQVANYYQKLAEKKFSKKTEIIGDILKTIPKAEREAFKQSYSDKLKETSATVPKELLWLEGQEMEDYLHDMRFATKFASSNRMTILNTIVDKMGGKINAVITSTHNYIDEKNILRKGATNAEKGNVLLIPLNMRDGVLVCVGKGNEDWNNSAPHGAGRLYSRAKAKEIFTIEAYQKSMEGIYTTCINQSTLDEAPFVYKDSTEIIELIEPTVEIIEHLIPIYNFKSDN